MADTPLGSKELFDSMLLACQKGDIDTLKRCKQEFLENENNFYKCVDMNGDTVLHKAVQKDTQCLSYCLDNLGVDVNRANDLGKTPLHLAVKNNYVDAVQVLLDKGVDCEVHNSVGSTPLHTAAACGSVECLQLLLTKSHMDVNTKDGNGNTVLHKCAYDGNIRVAETVIKLGAQVNVGNTEGLTPVHIAVKVNKVPFVKFLIGHGADISIPDQKANLPIHYCTSRCFHQMFVLLCANSPKEMINSQNQDGNTPLHVAAQNFKQDSKEWEEFIFDIIRMGGDVNATNNFNKKPSDFVNRNNYWLFDLEELAKEDEKVEKQSEEQAKLLAEINERKRIDMAERRRVKEEREQFLREEEERRKREEEERRIREEEEQQRLLEEEERRRLEEEEMKKKKKKRKPKKKDG
eukprot:TRINITY_DN65692_c0_g4_i1.p2 TRINITY_DN65692_c0_g4~~TRINITY_DN65692_c0_g4_i1.p2  ORF type:complete len:406 (-),score=69.51 TRINITY_DN65692_c0_g4_i1:1660-2877(-)